ncbi:AAA family ATPase [Miltoncostaea marina]|uniref:AAA family ATPase n=1 Tax=Miltoncostaea marina TaxID=2843215 RepID=UPI001C3E1A23|nr:AAA family ATPase [Miltoncostaea marina]
MNREDGYRADALLDAWTRDNEKLFTEEERRLMNRRLIEFDEPPIEIKTPRAIAAAAMEKYEAAAQRPKAVEGLSSWEPALDWDAALAPPPPPSILSGETGALLYAGKRHIVSGESETMKSWLALAAVAEVAREGLFAVFVDADDMGQASVMERLRDDLGVPERLVREHVLYIAPETRFDPEADRIVARLVRDHAVVLAVIDALNPALRLQGLSNLATDDIEDFLRLVVGAFHRRGVATLIVDHLPKNSENRGRYSIGSERKLSGVDVAFGVELVGEAMTRDRPFASVAIKCHKDRPGWHRRSSGRRLGTFEIDLRESPQWALKLAAEGVGQSKVAEMAERVGQVMGQHPEVTQTRCAEILGVERDNGTFRRGWAMARAKWESGPGGPSAPLYGGGGPRPGPEGGR